MREAITAAKNIEAAIDDRPLKPFVFTTLGQLATIGRRTGVAMIAGRMLTEASGGISLDTAKAIAISAELLTRGVYVSGFGFPVVPQGQARLRCQVSAAHERKDLDQALEAFVKVGKKFGAI